MLGSEEWTTLSRELKELVKKFGVVDFFFCGVDLSGLDVMAYRVGDEHCVGGENRHRIQRMTGIMFQGQMELNEDSVSRKAQEERDGYGDKE